MRLSKTLIAICATALALGLSSIPTRAGDIAGHHVLGFSPDASHFAFVEYGVADGSGAAYASLYILDTAADRYVGGSPFEVGGREGFDRTVAQAMDEAEAQAAAALSQLNIAIPPLLAAAAPPLQNDIERKSITFHSVAVIPPLSRMVPATISLETIDLPGLDYCPQPDLSAGFALSLTIDGTTTEIHRDTRIPQTRGCAFDYQIGAVYVPLEGRGTMAIALISVISQGFEGQYNRRFAAFPLALPGL